MPMLFDPVVAADFSISLDQVNWLGNIVSCVYLPVAILVPTVCAKWGVRRCVSGLNVYFKFDVLAILSWFKVDKWCYSPPFRLSCKVTCDPICCGLPFPFLHSVTSRSSHFS
jgi:hypothetical protein